MSELFMVVSLHAKPGKEDTLRHDLIPVVEHSRTEEGNIRYELFVDQSDPGRFVFVEHWASAEAQHKHDTQGTHIQEFNTHGVHNVQQVEFMHMLSRVV